MVPLGTGRNLEWLMSTNIVLKNTNQRNTLKVTPQNLEIDSSLKRVTLTSKWKDAGTDAYILPGQTLDIWVGENRRIMIMELPT
jgi:hypothetical protein